VVAADKGGQIVLTALASSYGHHFIFNCVSMNMNNKEVVI
jgi:hypothetical protein